MFVRCKERYKENEKKDKEGREWNKKLKGNGEEGESMGGREEKGCGVLLVCMSDSALLAWGAVFGVGGRGGGVE